MVMLVAAAALMSNLVYAYVFIPGPGLYVSLSEPPSGWTITVISGVNFYDANANGQQDEGEAGIGGSTILLYKWMQDDEGNGDWTLLQKAKTDDNGHYIFEVSQGIYKVAEEQPVTITVLEEWVQTAPEGGCHVVYATWGETYGGNDFGNVHLEPATGGKTMGFWGNKNGQALITSDDVASLNGLVLYTPDGWMYPSFSSDLATAKTQIKNYLRNATAVNMPWMLSAQLIATKLNVLHGFLSNSTIVYVESSDTIITIGEIMKYAYEALQGTDRDAQEYWKNLLDWVNNNWLPFVSTDPP
ncbi:MAG: SdrD B-like domain-containing protein [Thermoproteota archaeon]